MNVVLYFIKIAEDGVMKEPNLFRNMFRWLYGEEPMPVIDSVEEWNISSMTTFDGVAAEIVNLDLSDVMPIPEVFKRKIPEST